MGGELDDVDLQNFILEAGQYPVFEVLNNLSAVNSELSISHKLTEQSVSSDEMDTIYTVHSHMLARPNLTDMLTLTIPGCLSMSCYPSAYHLEPADPVNGAGGSPN